MKLFFRPVFFELKPKLYKLVVLLGFVVLAKLWLRQASLEHHFFLLTPLVWTIELFVHEKAVFVPSEGFFFRANDFIIDQSCAGANFFIISAAMLLYFVLFQYNKPTYLLVLLSLWAAYFLTYLANTSRIIIAVFIANAPLFPATPNHQWFHQLQGSFVYLLFLILGYLFVSYLSKKYTKT